MAVIIMYFSFGMGNSEFGMVIIALSSLLAMCRPSVWARKRFLRYRRIFLSLLTPHSSLLVILFFMILMNLFMLLVPMFIIMFFLVIFVMVVFLITHNS